MEEVNDEETFICFTFLPNTDVLTTWVLISAQNVGVL